MLQERLAGVYQELGSENSEPVLFSSLINHPIVQDIVPSLHTYKAIVSRNMSVAGFLSNVDTLLKREKQNRS